MYFFASILCVSLVIATAEGSKRRYDSSKKDQNGYRDNSAVYKPEPYADQKGYSDNSVGYHETTTYDRRYKGKSNGYHETTTYDRKHKGKKNEYKKVTLECDKDADCKRYGYDLVCDYGWCVPDCSAYPCSEFDPNTGKCQVQCTKRGECWKGKCICPKCLAMNGYDWNWDCRPPYYLRGICERAYGVKKGRGSKGRYDNSKNTYPDNTYNSKDTYRVNGYKGDQAGYETNAYRADNTRYDSQSKYDSQNMYPLPKSETNAYRADNTGYDNQRKYKRQNTKPSKNY